MGKARTSSTAARVERGFTFIEAILALALTTLLVLAMVSLSAVVERANLVVIDRTEAEHSGQSTLDYLIRDLEQATAFYPNGIDPHISIRYRIWLREDDNGDGVLEDVESFYALNVDADGSLIRTRYTSNAFNVVHTIGGNPSRDVISDGINNLQFQYSATGADDEPSATPPIVSWFNAPSSPAMFHVIRVTFTVTVRRARQGGATVNLQSAVTPLNITGVWSGLAPYEAGGEVV